MCRSIHPPPTHPSHIPPYPNMQPHFTNSHRAPALLLPRHARPARRRQSRGGGPHAPRSAGGGGACVFLCLSLSLPLSLPLSLYMPTRRQPSTHTHETGGGGRPGPLLQTPATTAATGHSLRAPPGRSPLPRPPGQDAGLWRGLGRAGAHPQVRLVCAYIQVWLGLRRACNNNLPTQNQIKTQNSNFFFKF